MSSKQIEVDCPCCDTRLVVDVLTRTVLRHIRPEQRDATGKAVLDESRWDAAQKRIQERSGGDGADRFDAALGRERKRERDLDDLFKKAQDQVEDRKRDRDA